MPYVRSVQSRVQLPSRADEWIRIGPGNIRLDVEKRHIYKVTKITQHTR